jgi:hypothetical protein
MCGVFYASWVREGTQILRIKPFKSVYVTTRLTSHGRRCIGISKQEGLHMKPERPITDAEHLTRTPELMAKTAAA